MSSTEGTYERNRVIGSTPRFADPAVRINVTGAPRVHLPATVKSAPPATAEFQGVSPLIGVIWTAVKSLPAWIEKKSRQARNRRTDAYLSQSTDHADLGRRVRGMEWNSQPNWSNRAAW